MNTTTANDAISTRPNVRQLVEHDRERIEEDDLDVEDDEDHGHQVEPHRESAAAAPVRGAMPDSYGPCLAGLSRLGPSIFERHERADGERQQPARRAAGSGRYWSTSVRLAIACPSSHVRPRRRPGRRPGALIGPTALLMSRRPSSISRSPPLRTGAGPPSVPGGR